LTELGAYGHDVLGGRAAAVEQDHRGAGFAQWVAGLHNGHGFVWGDHLVRSMTTA
jgi:hypothetical protein